MIEIKNKKAYYDYTVLETYEAGIVLLILKATNLIMRKDGHENCCFTKKNYKNYIKL